MEFVSRVTTQRWALAVLLDLKGVKKNDEQKKYTGAGLGLGFRLLEMDKGFYSLDTREVTRAYRNSQRRLILLDYGGTLLDNSTDKSDSIKKFTVSAGITEMQAPTEELVEILTNLCADPRNTVFVVSGKERSQLTETLGSVPNLGLAAEHGMYYRWGGGANKSNKQWETMVGEGEEDARWKEAALLVMDVYVKRTHGSYVEQTESKLIWQYRDTDPEYGYLQSREMEDHLHVVLKNHAVDILRGGGMQGGYIEVRPQGVNKGVLLMEILRNMATKEEMGLSFKEKVDFLFCMGDDHCDEPMFSVTRNIGRRQKTLRDKMVSKVSSTSPCHFTLLDTKLTTQRNATQRNATQRNATQPNATQRNATQRRLRSASSPPRAFSVRAMGWGWNRSTRASRRTWSSSQQRLGRSPPRLQTF